MQHLGLFTLPPTRTCPETEAHDPPQHYKRDVAWPTFATSIVPSYRSWKIAVTRKQAPARCVSGIAVPEATVSCCPVVLGSIAAP